MRPTIIDFFSSLGIAHASWLVPTITVMNLLVLLTMVALLVRRATAIGLPRERSIEMAVAASIGAIVMTRLYYLVVNGLIGSVPPSRWASMEGTASWGAELGVLLGLVLCARLQQISVLPYADIMASVAGLGQFIGRIGCLLQGDDFGRPTTLAWGIRFPEGSLAYQSQVAHGILPPGSEASLPVHPMQLLLAGVGLLLFLVATAIWRRFRHRPGVTLAVHLTLFGLLRFPLEFLRDPDGGGAVSGLSTSQEMCIVFVMAGSFTLYRALRRESGVLAPA